MSVHAPDALAVDCDEHQDGPGGYLACGAVVGKPCLGPDGRPRAPHPSRVAKAREAARSAPPRCWVQTASGVAFDLQFPRAADVRADDLAHSLAHINRFGGHLRVGYSVAQHSILAAALVWQRTRNRAATLAALLHDAHEAYTGDIKQPVKAMLESVAPGVLKKVERAIDEAIFAWAGLELGADAADQWARIKAADVQLLFWERDRWMGAPTHPWIGEAHVRRLGPPDFGVDEHSFLLHAWDSIRARAAFRWCLDALLHDRPSMDDGLDALPLTHLAGELARVFAGIDRAAAKGGGRG